MLTRAPLAQLLVGGGEGGLVFGAAVTADVAPHEVEQAPGPENALLATGAAERLPSGSGEAHALDRGHVLRVWLGHMMIVLYGLCAYKTCGSVVST